MISKTVCLTHYSSHTKYLHHLIQASSTLNHLLQLHTHIILNGLHSHLPLITKLADSLSTLDALPHAQLLFCSVAEPDLFLFNVTLRSLSLSNLYSPPAPLSLSNATTPTLPATSSTTPTLSLYNSLFNQPTPALSLYNSLLVSGLNPDCYTFAFAIRACTELPWPSPGRALHAMATVTGHAQNLFVSSTLAHFYLNFFLIDYSLKVFGLMPQKDAPAFNTMISGLVRASRHEEAVSLFGQMASTGSPSPDSTTLTAILPAMAELQELRLGRALHCFAFKTHLLSHLHVATGLVSFYAKLQEAMDARRVFNEIHKPDIVSYNAMISGYSLNGDFDTALILFREMNSMSLKPNSSTIVGLIPGFDPFGAIGSVHGYAFKAGMCSNMAVATAIVSAYGKNNDISSSRQLFDEIPEKSLASWNAMVSGYAQCGQTEDAIALFKHMQNQEVEPNPVTIASVLSACAQLGALTLGQWIHDLIRKAKYETNVFVSTALIDMYAKCGSIERARELFDTMPEKNVVSWNAMISGYGLHGHGHKALQLYEAMLQCGIAPTGVTYVGLLCGCSHAGLVAKGLELFGSMVKDHGLSPRPEHYACMVDLLGRAGRLTEAMDFITNMPIEPTSGVWGALLGACMVHQDLRLAQLAAKRLFELEPRQAGYRVLLANLYSAKGLWANAARVREETKNIRISKVPGCTLIELDGEFHTFRVGDRSHPRAVEIYRDLERLESKMAEVGYRVGTDVVLHDVEEEEKESMVRVHSEKLAIVLGLISTEPGSTIRIIKNLRVCSDCHNATKFMSMVTGRVIVVRDANRFHHFKDGACSCGDYW
ncbi:hypothetical protein AMTRI_Chr07g23570 [Amborella trichopoda]|uniref:pentatricopeptide repeat-containing protein At4g30700-like n=1 Tax=Amborella trichopoda TaxID=13333 RepID=UPI0009BC9AEB|nr:pentatricopeptide repeat-containing protein At4g30700-like [Amborella trichopoda]|eukprot:XP_020529270.1 pentatricopeptide repeat-containing protein At4g30700-like [Amborella trichopoda]